MGISYAVSTINTIKLGKRIFEKYPGIGKTFDFEKRFDYFVAHLKKLDKDFANFSDSYLINALRYTLSGFEGCEGVSAFDGSLGKEEYENRLKEISSKRRKEDIKTKMPENHMSNLNRLALSSLGREQPINDDQMAILYCLAEENIDPVNRKFKFEIITDLFNSRLSTNYSLDTVRSYLVNHPLYKRTLIPWDRKIEYPEGTGEFKTFLEVAKELYLGLVSVRDMSEIGIKSRIDMRVCRKLNMYLTRDSDPILFVKALKTKLRREGVYVSKNSNVIPWDKDFEYPLGTGRKVPLLEVVLEMDSQREFYGTLADICKIINRGNLNGSTLKYGTLLSMVSKHRI